ncbi:hypothetical protein LDJ79_08370 [Vibrio tritonius]|uniref:Uncharacterized protein n=1 Tax=Vibrio tritonius TaxID=1435069 RepID=A0ABS7YM45_9VIBR|nr:hypothetical protein [Vibrio tritonius]MCA2016122.1 hypothetical protein [Vibrio tritonius]
MKQTIEKSVKEIEDEKKEEKRKAAYERRKKADNIRKYSGLKMKKVHLHQETLMDLKTLARLYGFKTSDDELGYDDLSCLITLLSDILLKKNSFKAMDFEAAMLKRLHLTVKYCQYEDNSILAMDEYEISALLRDYKYTLPKTTIELLLGRDAVESDFDWSNDVIDALANERKVKAVINEITF